MNPLHTFSRGRKWNIALQVVAAVAAFMAIVVMVNYLSARHFKRFHWSDRGSMALTPRTLALLQSMTNQVEVTVFFDSEAVLLAPVNQVLEEYLAASPNLSVRKVSIDRNPAAAQAVRSRYNLPPEMDDNLVIFDHAGRKRVISERMLTDRDYEQVPNADQIELITRHRTFKGELMFTSAIADVIAPRDYKAYFLTGHNEHDPSGTEAQGYASFADLLGLNNLRFDVLSLGASGDIPDDCDLLIIAGPQQKFHPAELDRIEQYLNQGGRLLAMFSIGPALLTGTGLERLLAQWGVQVGANLVEDADNAQQGQAVAFLTSRFGQHPIASALGDTRLQVLSTRTIAARREAAGLGGASVTELVYTGTNAVVYTQFPDGQAIRTGRDPVGEFPLAVAVEKGGLPGVTTLRGGVTRIVVTGDAFMFGNQLLDYMGNRDFANQIINWLLDRSELMAGIGPRPMKDYQLALTPAQLRGVRLVLIAGLPLGALFVGFLVWLRRRS